MATTTLPPPPRQTANPAPPRLANSVRRTSSIDVSWPDGARGNRLMQGRARDILTPAEGGGPLLRGRASMDASIGTDKTIVSIAADPAPANLQRLVGERGGGHLRLVLKEVMPELIARADPLYLVLDDISGTALVSVIAQALWSEDGAESFHRSLSPEQREKMQAQRTNICWGLKEGNSGLRPFTSGSTVANADAGELRNPEDPVGWHDLPEFDGPGFRRSRRIDVTRGDAAGVIHVDSSFQDTAKREHGGLIAIHEYLLRLTVSADSLEIIEIAPEPRILPFSECPGAVHNTQRLVGKRIPEIRDEVLAQLRGTAGCTHLNDALRALAEVPRLAEYLD